jgi:hypothetical protein
MAESEASALFDSAKLQSLPVKAGQRPDEAEKIEEVVFELAEVGEFYPRRESHERNSECEWCRQFFTEQSRRDEVARPTPPSVRAIRYQSWRLLRWRCA